MIILGKSCLRYCKSTIFQANHNIIEYLQFCSVVVCDTAKVRFFKQITTLEVKEFNHKSCLRYCKSTIFQANHNPAIENVLQGGVVCDTAKVRFFKQITTYCCYRSNRARLFAILQKYDFSSKSQRFLVLLPCRCSCLRYCKSTIFQANHNTMLNILDGYGWER